MENSVGMKPKPNPYLQSSRMCGSCHTIDLPVVDSPIASPAECDEVHPYEVEQLADEVFVGPGGHCYELPVLVICEEVDGLARLRGGEQIGARAGLDQRIGAGLGPLLGGGRIGLGVELREA